MELHENPVCPAHNNDGSTFTFKTLPCGHVCCVTCLDITMEGSTLYCPQCATPCDVPGGQVDTLPTKFCVLDKHETSCVNDSCRSDPYDHTPEDPCEHGTGRPKVDCDVDKVPGLVDLEELIGHLSEECDVQNDIETITSRGENIITEITHIHEEQVRQLAKWRQRQVLKVREAILRNSEKHIQWQNQLIVEMANVKLFVDKTNIRCKHFNESTSESTVTSESSSEEACRAKIASLKAMAEAKPTVTTITMTHRKEELDKFLSNCMQIVFSDESPNINDSAVKPMALDVPDYTAAIYHSATEVPLNMPKGICVHSEGGNFIVTDIGNNVHIFTSKLEHVSSFVSAHYSSLFSAAVCSDGYIYFTDTNNHCVYVTDTGGFQLCTFGSRGTQDDQYDGPTGLAFDSKDNLYVCDSGNHRVKITDKEGMFIDAFGHSTFCNELPRFIAVSKQDDKVAVTVSSGNLYLFTSCGRHLSTIVGKASPQNIDFNGVAFDKLGNILASDYNGRLVVVKQDGEVICFIGDDGHESNCLKFPEAVAITAMGDIAVCDYGRNKVKMFVVPRNKCH